MTTKQHLQAMGLTGETVDALQTLRNAYSALHCAQHMGDERQKRAARRALELAKRDRSEKDTWN